MRPKTEKQNNLFDRGQEAWERTDEFKKRVNKVREELHDKYQALIDNERNWFKRQVIKIKFLIELKKRTNEISSMKNLHLMTSS